MIVRLAPFVVVLLIDPPVPAQSPGDGPSEGARELNADVVKFARSKMGQKVGDGQCTSLVISSLEAAGARRFPAHGDGDGELDYVWGEYVERPEDVRPGDVLQFHDAVFRWKTRERRGLRTVIRTETRIFPHHSAVVDDVQDGGRTIIILHQNAGPSSMSEAERQTVRREALDMDHLQEGGWIKAYHPVGG